MCPLLSSKARARAAHPLCLQFVTSEIFIGPRIFDKKEQRTQYQTASVSIFMGQDRTDRMAS